MSLLAFAPLLTARSEAARLRPFRLAARAAARRRARARLVLPVACLAAAAAFARDLSTDMTRRDGTPRALPAAERPAPPPGAVAAAALVQSWRLAGDESTVLQRLHGVVEHAGGVPAWSAEELEGGRWLVIWRDAPGWPAYAFEADAAAGTVTPTPESVEALTLMRVRDEADARLRLLARR